eukprot:c21637_g1_i2 orf=1129-4512(+)
MSNALEANTISTIMGGLGLLQGNSKGGLMEYAGPIVMDEPHGYELKTFNKKQHVSENRRNLNLEEDLALLKKSLPFPSIESTFSVLQKCRETKSLTYATCLYMCICQNGLQNLRALENFIVSMFVACESISDAQQVFNRLINRNEYSWTSLIQGYVDCGEWKYGLSLFSKMLDDCNQPSTHTYVALLKACARLRDLEKGQALHDEIVKEGYEENLFVGSTLVDMYTKCSSLSEAQDVFNSVAVRDVALWNTLIKGFEESGLCWEALDCLVRMQAEGVSPDAITYVSSLKACGSVGATETGKELHADIKRAGLESNLFVGSALVDMHAKCGALSVAQEVFDKLQVQDVVVWNTLITGYAQHAFVKKAFHCFEQMQLQAVLPNAATYVRVLKACVSGGSLDSGLEVHTEIVKRGSEEDMIIGTSLVDMYARCGALAEALEVLVRLSSRDVILYNALIAGYAEEGLFEEALQLVERMRFEGIFPDAITFSCLLKACAVVGALHDGHELHAEIVIEGFDDDCIVGNTLVGLYAKCSSLVEAEEIFGAMTLHDVVSWNALMAAYLENELDERVLDCFERLQRDGIIPDLTTFVCTLKACSNVGAINIGREIHAEIVQGRCETDVLVGTALVGMYAACGLLVEAQEVFDELPVQDAVLWTTLIGAYTEQGLGEEALNCFRQMQEGGISPNGITFVGALKACGSVEAIDQKQKIHIEVAKLGLEGDPFVGNALLYVYAKCGFLAEACEVFNCLQEHDVVSWNSIMAGYADQGLIDNVLDCFERMQLVAIFPDAVTYVCSLKACSRTATIDKGIEMHTKVVEDGYENNPSIGNSLVGMYACWGFLAEAQELFNELPMQSISSWNVLISGYVEHGLGEKALKLLEELQQEAVAPDVITYVSSLKACGCIGAIEKGRWLHVESTKRGYDRNSRARINDSSFEAGNWAGIESTDAILGTALIDMYCRCGTMLDAQEIFHTTLTKDLITWNSFLVGHARQGETESVFKLLDSMRKEGLQPDGFTFLCTLIVCSHAGLIGRGLTYFERMSKEYGIIATVEHLNCIVDILARAGRLEEALTLLEKMPLQPNFVTRNTLLGACHKWGSADLGVYAFECTEGIDEDPSGAFTLMSNIYAGLYV